MCGPSPTTQSQTDLPSHTHSRNPHPNLIPHSNRHLGRLDGWKGVPLVEMLFSELVPASTLKQACFAQPALVAIALGLYHVFTAEYGVVPDVVFGHSLGEIAAWCAGGFFSREQASDALLASLLTTHCSPLTTYCSSLTTRPLLASLLTTHCSPLTTHYPPLTTHYPLLHSLLAAHHSLPTTQYFLGRRSSLPIYVGSRWTCYPSALVPCWRFVSARRAWCRA